MTNGANQNTPLMQRSWGDLLSGATGIFTPRGAGEILDSAIGIFSPRTALERGMERSALYAAAKQKGVNQGWMPIDSNVNDIIGGSSPAVRGKVRQLVRDFPYLLRAVNVIVDYTVGTGIRFQSRVQKGNTLKLDTKKINEIESAISFWMDEADAAGKLHYYEMMGLSKRQDLETGEFLLVKKHLNDPKRFIPYALQQYEPDWLTDNGATPQGSNKVEQGIEFAPLTGQVAAYHFTDPDSWGKTIRISAEHVIHGFRTLRPGQLRGISELAAAVLPAHDLSGLMSSELSAAKMASKWLAVVKLLDPVGAQIGEGVTTSPTGKKIKTLENGIIQYLRKGEDIDFKANPRPGTNFPPFVRLILTMISVVTGAPYELLSGDYQKLNLATGKLVRADFSQQLRPISMRHVRHFGTPTLQPFFDSAVLAGKLNLPGYFTNPHKWQRGEWQPPGMDSGDTLRDTKAHINQVKSLLRSPQEICKARGREYEDVLNEIVEAKRLAMEKGLTEEDVSTAMANNPTAVADQK